METFFKPSEILESFLIVTTICKSHQGRSSEKRQSLSPNLHFCRDQQYCGGFGMRCVKSTRWNFGIFVSLSGVCQVECSLLTLYPLYKQWSARRRETQLVTISDLLVWCGVWGVTALHSLPQQLTKLYYRYTRRDILLLIQSFIQFGLSLSGLCHTSSRYNLYNSFHFGCRRKYLLH